MIKFDEKRKSMIKVKGGYSDTSGMSPYKTHIQIDEFDDRSRMILSNEVHSLLEVYFDKLSGAYINKHICNVEHEFCKCVLSEVFAQKATIQQANRFFSWRHIFEKNIHCVFVEALYNEVLDIIWYISDWISANYTIGSKHYMDGINAIFEHECIGYRFVDGHIVAITDDHEIEEIEAAAQCEFEGCRTHIHNAVSFLSDRDKKDYKNSIKESISAVEAMCSLIVRKENATLGDALKEMEKKRDLKGPLKSAFEKLYAYTNNAGGIRHAEGLFVSEVTFEEAKFMLVVCSAFVNYLISEYGKMI